MPFANEHAARQKDPRQFAKFRRENDAFGAGVHAIWGIRSNGKAELQSIRFDRSRFTVAEARQWLVRHKYRTTIEAAGGKAVLTGLLALFLLAAPVQAKEYHLGPRLKEKALAVLPSTGAVLATGLDFSAKLVAFPFRYLQVTLVDDFGIKESVWIAWKYDEICFH